jgi:hypothetical protein
MDSFAFKIGNITCGFLESIGIYSVCGYDFSDKRNMGYIAIIVIAFLSSGIISALKKK